MADSEEKKSSVEEKFRCRACFLGFTRKAQILKHRKTKQHKENEAEINQMRQQKLAQEQKDVNEKELVYHSNLLQSFKHKLVPA